MRCHLDGDLGSAFTSWCQRQNLDRLEGDNRVLLLVLLLLAGLLPFEHHIEHEISIPGT